MVGKDLPMVSIFKSSPFLFGPNRDCFEVIEPSDDRQEFDDTEGSGKEKALSMEGGSVVGKFAEVSSFKFEAEAALRRGDFAGVGGLTFSVFSDVLNLGGCFSGASANLGEDARLISGNENFPPIDKTFRDVSPTAAATSDPSALVGALLFGPRALAFVICHNDQREKVKARWSTEVNDPLLTYMSELSFFTLEIIFLVGGRAAQPHFLAPASSC